MEEEYQSGLGKESKLPPELKGWNWGAFFLNWIWGIGNSTYLALLMFVPFVNIVMIFILGAKGNKWAWQNRIWRDVEHFKNVQRKWTIASLVLVLVVFPLLILSIGSMLKGEAYQLSLTEIENSPEVVAFIGKPIEPGFFVMGEISHSGDGVGKAILSYSISGSKEGANVVLVADKKQGVWHIEKLIVYNSELGKQFNVIGSLE